jgi:hypothetical protein
MKRILFISLLIAASSSFALVWSINRRAATVEETIIAQEKQIIEAINKKDQAAFKNLVSQDAMVVGMHGPIKAAEALPILFGPDYKSEGGAIESPQVKMMDKDAYMITYKATGTESYKGESMTNSVYASTLWVKQGDKWVAMFHQVTLIPDGKHGGQ